ncbi:hypothetical protein [Actinoplanes sp. NPDC026619]|uniref:hypothetical protein n=1 Tax=Actinoplanes sp. NPDC026619 TaxID=3155798 RepID=UPI0033F520F1
MDDEALYDDGRVRLDADGVTLRRYYFPTGVAKHIPYHRIRAAGLRPMNWLTGKGRVWGTAHPGYWLPWDTTRPGKHVLVVLDVGAKVRPAFTPDDPDRVVELIRQHIPPH